MKKVIYVGIILLLLLIISMNVLSIYNIPLFKMHIYKIGSGSMEPYLKVNSLIVVKETDDYKVDDVVTYNDSIGYVTHRIISLNNDIVITKGDANNTKDEPITRDKIIGKVVFRLPFFSFISNIMSKPIILVSVLAMIGLIICLIPNKKN